MVCKKAIPARDLTKLWVSLYICNGTHEIELEVLYEKMV